MLVEDDPLNARVFEAVLKSRGGFEVTKSQNVEEILALAQGLEVDIILMDVSLSQSTYKGEPVNGIRITQMLKANSSSQSIPVILVTAHAMQGDRENFLAESGAEDYIAKPVVDHQGMVDKINVLIQSRAR
ncbi:MAG: response regulator [Cyanobacteria bacterium J06648_11]